MVVSNGQITDNQAPRLIGYSQASQVMLLQYRLRGYEFCFFVSFTAVSSALRTVGGP